MKDKYMDVTTRFLREDERLIVTKEQEMPLVIEAKDSKSTAFLNAFLNENSPQILSDIERYGAILLRGFDIESDDAFENAILSIKGLQGIRHVFMSEEGRDNVDNLSFVLHTNSVYKTGGTVYLGGFHSENYYSPDVPHYICFCCLQPSQRGGETGLINTKKIYPLLNNILQKKLENSNFFASKWLISEVAERYHVSTQDVIQFCKQFDLPLVGEGANQFILMYKPNVFINPRTQEKTFQINFFEIPTLNKALRHYFMADYRGKNWFWHRFVWRLPEGVMRYLEYIYMSIASLIHSPTHALQLFRNKYKTYHASKTSHLEQHTSDQVSTCFSKEDVDELAQLMHDYYCSCLWQKGDVLLIDNTQVIHAGMPGAGSRLIRAMICNPLQMSYSSQKNGVLNCNPSNTMTIGEHYMNQSN